MADYDHHVAQNKWIHGEGVANCGSIPTITIDFWMAFSRSAGSNKVTWSVHDLSWAGWGASRYGYYIYCAIAVNPADPDNPDWDTELYTVLEKDNTVEYNWDDYVDTYTPSNKQSPSTSSKAKVYMYVKAQDDCQSGGHWCYPKEDGHDWYMIGDWEVDVPPYETSKYITYVLNGGSGSFPQQEFKSNQLAIQLHTWTPTNKVNINYNIDGAASRETANKTFNNWLGSDTNTYSPGDYYTTHQDLTLTAQWGTAPFVPKAIPDKYYVLTYNYNQGSGTPASSNLARTKLGYATSSSGTTYPYQPGTTYYLTGDLNLWAKWGGATVFVNSLPAPTRTGYKFDGWFKDIGLTQKITSNYTINANTTIYAGWSVLPLYQLTNNDEWDGTGPYVWQCVVENGTKVWRKIAHIYQCTNDGHWEDVSEPSQGNNQ